MKALALAGIFAVLTAAPLFGCGPEFEEAPPTLDFDLDSLPQKSLEQIFEETKPPSAPDSAAYAPGRIKEIAERAKKEPAGKLIVEVDHLLAAVRSAGGDHDDLAILHDLRDGLSSSPADCEGYLLWRLDHAASMKPVQPDPNEFPQKPPPVPPPALLAEIEKNAADAKGPMRAHWLYLRGAVSFNYGDKMEAQKWFDKVVEEFPRHPRAEIALFMSGRCLLAQSRVQVSYYEQSKEKIDKVEAGAKTKHAEAIARFRQYLEKYPEGRFVADAYGWLGALDSGVTSLDDYIHEVEMPGHPEVLASGIKMIQQRLEELTGDTAEADAAVALVAKHPRVAMGMLYVTLGARADEFQDDSPPDRQSSIPPLVRMEKWRNTILPALAAAVASQKDLYAPADIWQPRYLAILAQAASNAGVQADALKLTEMAPKALEQSDDLLFTRAIALERAGNAADAIAAFQNFLSRFPKSPLAPGARVRYGIVLRDNHQSGLAVLELKKFLARQSSNDELLSKSGFDAVPDSFYIPTDEVRQVIDSILNFAPLQELAGALDDKDIDPGFAMELRAIIAARALGQEDFATARKFMTSAQFALGAANLEELSAQAKATENREEKAKIEARLGDAWAAQRGRLLGLKGLPADFGDETELAEINRRINGKTMGYDDVESELDERDELRHASRWWLRAARRVPATPLSAACRLKALEAIAKVAAKSDYAFQRAVEDNMAKASREIYDKLQSESPHSAEAGQAAYWTFLPPGKNSVDTDKSGFAGEYFADRGWEATMRRKSGYYWSDYGISGEPLTEWGADDREPEDWKGIGERILALRDTTKSIPELATEVGELRKIASSHFSSVSQDACLNFLDDIVLFLGEPRLTGEIIRRYINLRLDVLNASSWDGGPAVPELVGITRSPEDYSYSGINGQIRDRIASALSDPAMKPVADYLEFLDAAMVANSQVSMPLARAPDDKGDEDLPKSRDYPALEKMVRTFLERHPHSRKREAARLLLAKAVYRQSWPIIETTNARADDISTRVVEWESLKPKRVFAELDAYDREFPKGRYSPEIRDMRASVCSRSGDWKSALDLTVRQLDGQLPDLKRDAVLRLANIFAGVGTPEHRPALIAAIRENPSALAWFKVYLAKAPDYRDHPLRFMTGYLEDQLGFKLPGTENQKPATKDAAAPAATPM